MAFAPDGKLLASAGGKTISLWDPTTGNSVATLEDAVTRRPDHALFGETICTLHCVAFSPDGKILAGGAGYERGAILLWDVATRKTKRAITSFDKLPKYHTGVVPLPTEGVISLAFSPDGRTLASGRGNLISGELKLWDVSTGKNTATLRGHGQPVHSVAFSPDGKTLASGSSDMTVRLWDVATGKGIATFAHDTDDGDLTSDLIACLAYSPDGKMVATTTWSGKLVRLWDVRAGKNATVLKGHKFNVSAVAFSPDGKVLASADSGGSGGFRADCTIRLWDVATGKAAAVEKADDEGVLSLAFSPDGKTLASGSKDKTVKLWHVAAVRQDR